MDGFNRTRVAAMAKQLENELRSTKLVGADRVLGQMQSVFDRISDGTLTAPIRRAPGGRHFLESELPGDDRISSLYVAFCNAVEGK